MLVYAYSIEVSENDSCPYTYDTYGLNKENACVILKGEKRAYFYPTFENEKCSAYYLSSPIDTDDVVGIKIGEKIYYAE